MPADPLFGYEYRFVRRLPHRLEPAASAAFRRAANSDAAVATNAAGQLAWRTPRNECHRLRHQSVRRSSRMNLPQPTIRATFGQRSITYLAVDVAPAADELCNLFVHKAEHIRSSTSGSSPPLYSIVPENVRLTAFENSPCLTLKPPLPSSRIIRLGWKWISRSTASDPFSFSVLKAVADRLSPSFFSFNLTLDVSRFQFQLYAFFETYPAWR